MSTSLIKSFLIIYCSPFFIISTHVSCNVFFIIKFHGYLYLFNLVKYSTVLRWTALFIMHPLSNNSECNIIHWQLPPFCLLTFKSLIIYYIPKDFLDLILLHCCIIPMYYNWSFLISLCSTSEYMCIHLKQRVLNNWWSPRTTGIFYSSLTVKLKVFPLASRLFNPKNQNWASSVLIQVSTKRIVLYV